MKERERDYGVRYRKTTVERSRATARKNHHANREKRLGQMAAYRKTEAYRESRKKYNSKRDHILAWRKQWRLDNKEAISALNKKYYEANRESEKERRKLYLRTERGKQVFRVLNAKRRAMKKNALREPYDANDLAERFRLFGDRCAYCGKHEHMTIDHFWSLANGGEDTIRNIVPACRSCNSSKANKNPWSWLETRSFFDLERARLLLGALAAVDQNERSK